MKCSHCEEQLEDISFNSTINGGVNVFLSHKEQATLYVCTSADCINCGVVLVIPHKTNDEREKEQGIS